MRTEIGKLVIVSGNFPIDIASVVAANERIRYCCVCKVNPSIRVIYNPNIYNRPNTSYLCYPSVTEEGPDYTYGDLFLCEKQECLDIILLLNAEKI